GAAAPQRVRAVGGDLGLRHRHLHRLVAGLRGRIVDRRQLRLLADLGETVDRRATAGDRSECEQRTGQDEAVDTVLGHELYSAFGATELSLTGAEFDSEASALGAASGVATEIETSPRPETTPDTARLDCRFITLTTSPSAPPSIALPRMVR